MKRNEIEKAVQQAIRNLVAARLNVFVQAEHLHLAQMNAELAEMRLLAVLSRRDLAEIRREMKESANHSLGGLDALVQD